MNNKIPGYCDFCGIWPVVDEKIAEQHPERTYICTVCFHKYIEPCIKEEVDEPQNKTM